MKLVLCGAKPSERAGGLFVLRHLSILALGPKFERVFDRGMPVL
jgi:hypothetical protein